MRHFFKYFFAVIISASASYAQDTTSVKVKEYHFQEIVISGHRKATPEDRSILAKETVSGRELRYITVNSAAYALQTGTGMDFKDYGGPHNLKTLSFRGSTAEQTSVMINGIPVNSPASGQIDISLIPLQNIRTIEVYRNGAVAGETSGAIGGSVNILTGPADIRGKSYNEFHVQATSFDHRRIEWSYNVRLYGWRSTLNLSKEFMPDSSYQVNNPYSGKKVYRVNTQTDKNAVTWNIARDAGKMKYAFFTQWVSRHNQIPNTINNNTSELSRAKQFDRLVIVNPQAEYAPSGKLRYRFSGSFIQSRLIYDNALSRVHSELGSHSFGITASAEYRWNPNHSTTARYAYTAAEADGDMLSSASSRHHALYGNQLFMFYLPPMIYFDRAVLNAGAGIDYENHYGAAHSLKANGYLYRDYKQTLLFVRSAAARNFRYPTFNERFWSGDGGRGNPAIRPEKGYLIDGGAGLQHNFNPYHSIKAESNLFYSQTSRQIVWQAGVLEPGVWTPVNLTETRNQGYEMSICHQYDSLVSKVIFIRSRPIDLKQASGHRRLPYAPLYTIKLTNYWKTRHWMFFHSTRYYSERFVDLQNTAYLKPYWLTDFMMQWWAQWRALTVTFELSFRNVFDETYEPVALYPGLAREFSLGVTIGF